MHKSRVLYCGMWFIIFILLIPNVYSDLKFDDIEQEMRANNDKNYVEYLKNKNSKAKKLKVNIAEHKKHKEKMKEYYKNAIKEQFKLRKSKKDLSKLEELHNKEKLVWLEQYKKVRNDYIKNRDKQKQKILLQSQAIETELLKNLHILEESTSKSYRVEKEKREY